MLEKENATVMFEMTSDTNGDGEADGQSSQILKATASSSCMIMDGREVYYTVEGETYYAYDYDAMTGKWTKSVTEYAMFIGTDLMANFITPFMGMYEELSYIEEEDVYYGENVVVTDNMANETTLTEVEIVIKDGVVCSIRYVGDILKEDSDGNMVVAGTTEITMVFVDLDETDITLPEVEDAE